MVSGVFKRHKEDHPLKEYEENCSPPRSSTADRITLGKVLSSPSKLNKGVISESRFVQIRKKSVDMIDMPEFKPVTLQVPSALKEEEAEEEERKEKEEESKPRRKISNVHFALTMAGQCTPPVPHTPPVEHKSESKFAFSNRESLDHSVNQDSDSYSEREDSSEEDSVNGSGAPETPLTPVTPFTLEQANMRTSVDSVTSQGSIRITRHSNRAHTKATEIFQRSNSMRATHGHNIPLVNTPSPLTQHSVSHQPHTPPPVKRQESVSSRTSSSCEPEDEEESIQKWPDTSTGCPIHQNHTPSLQQRRTRKTAIGLEQPEPNSLLLPPPKSSDIFRRSPSRSPTRKRTQRDMLVDNALRSVMSMSEDAIVCANAQGELVFWSAGAVKMFGYTSGEAIGSSLQVRNIFVSSWSSIVIHFSLSHPTSPLPSPHLSPPPPPPPLYPTFILLLCFPLQFGVKDLHLI